MISCINIVEALYELTKGHEVNEKFASLYKYYKNYTHGLLWNINFDDNKTVIIIFLKVYGKEKYHCFIWEQYSSATYWRLKTYGEWNQFKYKNKQLLQLIKVEPFYDYCLKNSKFINTNYIKKIIIGQIHKYNCINLRNENDFIKYKPLLGIIQFLEQNKILTTHNIYYCINDNVYIIGDKNTGKYRLIEYTNESKYENEIIYLKNTIANSYIELIAYYDNLKISISYSYNINKLISIISKKNHNYIKIMTNKIDYSGHIKNLIY